MCNPGGDPEETDVETLDNSFLTRVARTASSLVAKNYYRTALNVQNKTLEDFGRMEWASRRPPEAISPSARPPTSPPATPPPPPARRSLAR